MDNDPSYPWLTYDVTASNSDPDNHAQNTGEEPGPEPDNEYYFELVVFKVGNKIFRVPKSGFVVPGTIFETMFSLPTMGENIEGLNDQNPINLPVNEEKFRGFLRVMYPFNGLSPGSNDLLGALDLSTMWMFDEMRDRAIKALQPWIASHTAKEVVLLAKKYRVLKWLKNGYVRIIEDPKLTTLAVLSATPSLDWETIARLLSARLICTDRYQQGNSIGLAAAVEQVFREEFSGMIDGVNNNPV